MTDFNVKKVTENCITWIRNWFRENGNGCNAVIGISGGKDSSVTAALCVAALGKERTIGILLPQGIQPDIADAKLLCKTLGIKSHVFNIGETVDSVYHSFRHSFTVSEQTKTNLPARIRMAVLYAFSQSHNGRVANTGNLSEDWIGYSTRYGDAAGDFSPLGKLTATEIKQIGTYLGLPDRLIHKPPLDGLCGKTDEENLGFSYDTLDKYLREGIYPPPVIKAKIDRLHRINLFKQLPIPVFPYQP